MKEGVGKHVHSYPVKVISTRIDWILNENIGKQFLEALYKSENLEYYNIMYLRTLIEHIYRTFKKKNQTVQKFRLSL